METKIDLRISAQTKETLNKLALDKGIKVSKLVRQVIEDYCNMSDKLPTSDNLKGKLSDNVSTKKEAPKIENKTQNKIDVGNMSLAQIMQLKRINKA